MVLFKAVYQGRYAPQTIESRRALLHGIVALALPHHFVTDLVQAYPAFKVSLVRQHFREDDPLGSAYRRELTATRMSLSLSWPHFTYRRALDIYSQPFVLSITSAMDKTVLSGWQVPGAGAAARFPHDPCLSAVAPPGGASGVAQSATDDLRKRATVPRFD